MSLHLTHSKRVRGFTIGEVVLASFMLVFGITTVIGLIGSSFRTTVDTERLILAAALSQEGIELVRNVRDNALVDKAATGSTAHVFETAGFKNGPNQNCAVDYSMAELDCPATGSVSSALSLNSSGYYGHGGSTGLFYRVIKTDYSNASPDRATVRSFVAWQDPGTNLKGPTSGATSWCTLANKCVFTEAFLTEWQ